MFIEKIDTCYNNPDLSSTTKINQHIPSRYSIYTNCSFDKSNNKLSYYRGEDCMKRFCKDLKDHATKIIDFKKKTMIPLTKEEEDNYNKENTCHICKNDFNNDDEVRDLKFFLNTLLTMMKTIDINENTNLLLAGDFIVFFNTNLECSGGNPSFKQKSVAKLIEIIETFNLCDIWRIRNPKTRRFTFRQQHCSGFIQRRLDYIFISNFL